MTIEEHDNSGKDPSLWSPASESHLDKPWALRADCIGELRREIFDRLRARGFDTHAVGQLNPVEFGIVQVEHRKRLRPGIHRTDPRELNVENGVGAIGE